MTALLDFTKTDSPVVNTASLRRWAARCLQGDVQSLPREFSEGGEVFVVQYLQDEGVLALIGEAIACAPGVIAVDAEQLILGQVMRCAALDMYREREVERVFGLFREANIDFIVLKGEALAHSYYRKPYQRQRSDVDLFFPDKLSAHRAREILGSHDYVDSNTLQGEFVGLQFTCSRELSGNHSLHFDMHSAICDYLWFARRLPYTQLRYRTEQVKVGSVSVATLDTLYLLLHACVHHAVNRCAGIHDRLIWLYDIKLLCARLESEQWNELGQICREKDLSQTVLEGLRSAQMVFSLELPVSFLEGLNSSALTEEVFIRPTQRRWQIYLSDFLQNPGLHNKLKQLREHLLPGRAYIVTKYELDDTRWVPYYYVKRLWQGAFKYSR